VERLGAIVDRLSDWALAASTVLVLYLMATQTLEVVLRSLGRPTTWVFDLNLIAIVGVVFLGLAGAERGREHVAVEFLSDRFQGRTRRLLILVNGAFALTLLAMLTWFGLLVALESIAQGRTTGGLFPVSAAIPEGMLPLGATLLWLQILVDMYRALRSGAPPPSTTSELETAAGDIPA
jgi:TRAP-type C4-dicarboxylate transport system permease small subunit